MSKKIKLKKRKKDLVKKYQKDQERRNHQRRKRPTLREGRMNLSRYKMSLKIINIKRKSI